MAKTYLDRNASYYERIIREAKNSPHAPNYQKVCIALKGLVQISNQLKGENHKMSQEEYNALTKSYKDVYIACEGYLREKENFNDFEKKRGRIISDISKVVKKDLSVLLKCNPLELGSLSEVMEKSRIRKIILDEKGIETVGAVLSNRIPLRTNSGKKGFFTPKSIYNQDKKWAEKVEKFEAINYSVQSLSCVRLFAAP